MHAVLGSKTDTETHQNNIPEFKAANDLRIVPSAAVKEGEGDSGETD